jgi:hypothetical protein
MLVEVVMWESLIKELPCLTNGADLGVLLGDLYDVLNRGYTEVLDNLWTDSVKTEDGAFIGLDDVIHGYNNLPMVNDLAVLVVLLGVLTKAYGLEHMLNRAVKSKCERLKETGSVQDLLGRIVASGGDNE